MSQQNNNTHNVLYFNEELKKNRIIRSHLSSFAILSPSSLDFLSNLRGNEVNDTVKIGTKVAEKCRKNYREMD